MAWVPRAMHRCSGRWDRRRENELKFLTTLVGVDRARAMLEWEISQGTTLIRLGALLAVVFGRYIVFAVTGRQAA